MSTQNIKSRFEVEAKNLKDTMEPSTSFKIPHYQRIYRWGKGQVIRLLDDALSELLELAESGSTDEAYRYLGAIILVKENDPNFKGSMVVIDGQQRLITLCLLCCALFEQILLKQHCQSLRELDPNTRGWLEQEVGIQLEDLSACIRGAQASRYSRQGIHYPKITRADDQRPTRSAPEGHYKSPIADFLMKFSEHHESEYYSEDGSPRPGGSFPTNKIENTEDPNLRSNFKFLHDEMGRLFKRKKLTRPSIQSDYITSADFSTLRFLFTHNESCEDFLETISGSGEQDLEGITRLVLFSSYLLSRLVLTVVKTDNENYAYDIFDALNTTGEPLTALEAFQPKVVSFEGLSYANSESKKHFDQITKVLNKKSKRHDGITKEMLVSFALYYDGTRLPKRLSAQRNYLQKNFDSLHAQAKDEDEKKTLTTKFVASIHTIAQFYAEYWWEPEEINNNETVRLCMSFISGMKTTLAIPILARYWEEHGKESTHNPDNDFTSAAKAVTAFLALRRAITGGTEGIDDDFRGLMKLGDSEKGTLCVRPKLRNGNTENNSKVLAVADLKTRLRRYLANLPLDETPRPDKPYNDETFRKKWIRKACQVPLAMHSKPLCKFLFLAAAHKSSFDPDNPGLLKRTSLQLDRQEANYLSAEQWFDISCETVEHIAPKKPEDMDVSDEVDTWDRDLYYLDRFHQIGNIVLLPKEINTLLSNNNWDEKKRWYENLSEENHEIFSRIIEEASDEGKITEKLISRLALLDALKIVDEWNWPIVEQRTSNLLTLAWDTLAPWLGYGDPENGEE